MSRARIIEVLNDAGYGSHAAMVESLLQPAIFIRGEQVAYRPQRPGDEPREVENDDGDLVPAPTLPDLDEAMHNLPLGASRFGGIPDLPPGCEWPVREGVPMEFVAQIRLADVAGLDPLERLPATGSLLFFYNTQQSTSDADGGACGAVLYHAGADHVLVRARPPQTKFQGVYDPSPRLAPYVHGLAKLSFAQFECLPGGISPFTNGTPVEKFWQDFCANHDTKWMPQGDAPYMSNRLLGYIEAQDRVNAHANGKNDQLLLQVDSDSSADFRWGDNDRLHFVLTRQELAARDFSKVRVYSQLG